MEQTMTYTLQLKIYFWQNPDSKYFWLVGIQFIGVSLSKPLSRTSILETKNNTHLRQISTVVLKLYKHAEPLRSFPSFCRNKILPNTTERKNGLLKSDDPRRTLGVWSNPV